MSDLRLSSGFKVVRDGHDHELFEVSLRQLNAGDVFDAQSESELLTPTPHGYELLTSDHLLGLNTLRRQIASIDDHPGPLSIAELRKLSSIDLNRILSAAQAMEALAIKAIEKRGRSETVPG